MEFTKKMILVDPRWVDTLQQSAPLPDPMGQSIRDLDSEMRDILDRQEMSVQDKAHLYQKTLQSYLSRVNQYRGKPLGMVDIKPQENKEEETKSKDSFILSNHEMEKNVLESVPATLKKKAERLLSHLKQNADLSWNERGEISLQGQTVKNSNLIDLVNDVLRQRKQARQPTGWETFATALSHSNVSQDLIGHPERWKYIHTQMQTQEGDKLISNEIKSETSLKSHKKKKRKSQEHLGSWEKW